MRDKKLYVRLFQHNMEVSYIVNNKVIEIIFSKDRVKELILDESCNIIYNDNFSETEIKYCQNFLIKYIGHIKCIEHNKNI